ncbi:MAG: 1-(5-phosphoribosyl)-5-amino-4-imidazole-carboxylate carboxylase, partial [Kiritimatiellia bacterium]|nr:1-(5-phosphoribosyl)-5-amino-4-imidazole-carboxylate carboxylase [Kiritimatiellia bacterium]
MNPEIIRNLLDAVAAGELSSGEAASRLQRERDLGFARLDLDRGERCGQPEVIYCPGKTAAQVAVLLRALGEAGQNGLATRATPELARAVLDALTVAESTPPARV